MSDEPFVTHRRLLFTVAYEMLGSAADAEDVVQEIWLRWADLGDAARDELRDPRSYLVRPPFFAHFSRKTIESERTVLVLYDRSSGGARLPGTLAASDHWTRSTIFVSACPISLAMSAFGTPA
jgi:hypothetical protein